MIILSQFLKMGFDCIKCGENEIWDHETLMDICRDCYHKLKLGDPNLYPKNPQACSEPITLGDCYRKLKLGDPKNPKACAEPITLDPKKEQPKNEDFKENLD